MYMLALAPDFSHVVILQLIFYTTSWAAFNGYEDIVRLLLTRPDVNTGKKDAFDRTPMLCAAEKHHAEIVQLLSPARTANRLSAPEKEA